MHCELSYEILFNRIENAVCACDAQEDALKDHVKLGKRKLGIIIAAGDILEDFVHRPDGFFSMVVCLGRFIQYVLSVVFHKTPLSGLWGYSITYGQDMQKRKVYT